MIKTSRNNVYENTNTFASMFRVRFQYQTLNYQIPQILLYNALTPE